MHLKLRLVVDGHTDDVAVDVDPHATVGELADRIRCGLPGTGWPPGCALGLVVEPGSHLRRVVAPDVTIAASGLRSGVSVAPTTARLTAPEAEPAATLVVHEGPDAPASFPLAAGTTSIGRGRHADVRLGDPLVSKRHARVLVADSVEIVDESSANGLVMSGRTIDRAVLRTGDRITLGDTTVSVTTHANGAPTEHNQIAFNRSPRLDPRYAGVELVAPDPPQPPSRQRFPIVSLLAPLMMAGMIYAVTRSTLSILFVALSPIMMIGGWFENRVANRKQLEHETAQFRASLADLAAQLEYAQQLERTARRREHPSVISVLDAVEVRAPLVWTRRPEHASFGQIRLGLGTQPSRNTVEMPTTNKTLPHLWRELNETVARFSHLSGVPIVADVARCGNVGVGGPDHAAAPIVRGLLAQFVGLHSPAELALAAIGPADGWDWIKWLPHTAPARLATNAADGVRVVADLEALIDERSGRRQSDDTPTIPTVIAFVHDDAPVDRARLVQIAERGPAVGVHLVWSAPSVEQLPAACRTFVEVDANTGAGRAGFVQGGEAVVDLRPEPAGHAAIDRLARSLSPMVDAGATVDVESELPRSVALVDITGHELATAVDAVTDPWRESRSIAVPGAPPRRHDHGLRAIVGQTADGPLHLDLREHGPHALVGGTTGSGKSEFLQSWLLGMAANNSPSRVTFLLVDYKGGAAFADCVRLPHCVGLVTDLSPHLVRRALTSLDAELRHREELLHRKRAKDLLELERRDDPDCPPSLVIVVDEFAALVNEVPEFVDGVVNVAQRGRSLGLHLILATQRPAGVIKDNLRANTNLRIALRMADEEDSVDVIGTDQAALFDPAIPGRAIVKSGPGRVTPFQSAYVGGHSAGNVAANPIAIVPLRMGPSEPWELPEPEQPPATQLGPTDIRRIVANINDAADSLDLAAPRRPWLPELAESYRLEALPTERTDTRLVFGVVDDPDSQAQPEVGLHPDAAGNLAVFGTGGSGKSTFLRSIAVAAGFAPARGGPCWVYGLDFGSRGLQMLETLPHVGSVIAGDDAERLQRLLRHLKETVDERAIRYARSNAATIDEYRRRTGATDEPRVIVLVDGVGTFRSEYEGGMLSRWWDMFQTLAADGRGVGVHFVLSADRPTAISSALASAVQQQLVLRLANEMDYALVDAPADAFGPQTPAGRGFVDGRETQVAVIGGERDVAEQAAAIDRLAASMRKAGVVAAPPIESLPERVALSVLPPTVDGAPTFGVWDETLGAIGVESTPSFLVAGAPQSGTSTAVATLITSIATARPETEFVLLGQRRSPLTNIVTWAALATGELDIAQLAERLTERLASVSGERVVVVVEAIGELLNTGADLPLQDLIRACRDAGAFVIAEGETGSLTGSWPLLQAIKVNRSGIVLQPDQIDGEALLKTPFPRTTRAEFPAGRGLMVQGGRVRKVQVALPE